MNSALSMFSPGCCECCEGCFATEAQYSSLLFGKDPTSPDVKIRLITYGRLIHSRSTVSAHLGPCLIDGVVVG